MYCGCGCGRVTNIMVRPSKRDGLKKGEHRRFIRGHTPTRNNFLRFHVKGPSNINYRHGLSGDPLYQSYKHAESRCNNKLNRAWQDYGGRGIRLNFTLDEWCKELGPRPTPKHTVDRINNNGHYETGNVRWATKVQQMKNRRRYTTLQKYSIEDIFKEIERRSVGSVS